MLLKGVFFLDKLEFLIVSKRQWQFTFNGRKYLYFYHPCNETWRNERAVELPIILEEVEKHNAERILEVGNVLSYYYPFHHTVIDKHEKGDEVINLDVIDFHTTVKYDLILSISTIEHIGYDEDISIGKKTPQKQQDPLKPLRVIQHLKNLLAQDGKLLVTIPLGWNPTLDKLLRDDYKSIFTGSAFLKRISKNNEWVQVEFEETRDVKYGSPFPHANMLAIYTFDHKT
jgi:SAM-dependent methyltransferase